MISRKTCPCYDCIDGWNAVAAEAPLDCFGDCEDFQEWSKEEG